MTAAFVQATNEDILRIFPQSAQHDSLCYGREVFEQNLMPLEGRAMAVHDQGRCVGAYGLLELWPNVARVWALLSEDLILQHPAVLGLHMKRNLDEMMAHGFHRVEATVGVSHTAGQKFLQWLEFKREGLMQRYTSTGLDMYLYAKVSDVT